MKCDWPKWPEILANKLGMDCINVGFSGSVKNTFIQVLLIIFTEKI